ncbi:MAG: glycosyltransferase [Prevotellaceae bacterium]|nr:glycosyltransferase [Prevotellaceae bacterium]
MNNKLSFYTIIQGNEPIILLKDPGMIPQMMSHLGYKCFFVSYIKEEKIEKKISNQIHGMELIHLNDDRKGRELSLTSLNILRFIWKNAKKIDVLNLYFLKHSILYACLFKILNPKGILYLKLDLNAYIMESMESQKIEHIRRFAFKSYLKNIPDIVSIESQTGFDYVKNRYGINTPKLIKIPNGIDDLLIKNSGLSINKFQERDNVILTVGRIGSKEKNNEMLLDAIIKIKELKDWTVMFVGPVTPSFSEKVKEVKKQHPELSDKIILKGAIYDRIELFRIYNKSKVFCMTSDYESFGLVYVEALYFGNYILSTKVPALIDFTRKDEEIGKCITDSTCLSKELSSIINEENKIDNSFNKRVNHALDFSWSNLCKQLDIAIQSRLNKK